MVHADEYHVVAPGPCVEEGDAYCIRRVPNSFCSVTKNECFCQPAFVAIQEEYGITCKPCHLAEKQSNNSFCEKCSQINGICFYAESTDNTNNKIAAPKFGCSCPYVTAMPIPRRGYDPDDQTLTPFLFCRAILVKQVPCGKRPNLVGQESSICVDLNGDGIPDENFCSRNGSSHNLSPLHPGSGESSGQPMSISYSHDWPALDVILEKGNEVNRATELEAQNGNLASEHCKQPLIHLSCSLNRFMACFLPPTWPPYQQLHQSLTEGTAIAYLTGERQAVAVISRNCVLKSCDFGHDAPFLLTSSWELGHLRNFCVNLDVDIDQSRLPCGLMLHKNETVISIKGLLEVRTDARVWQSSVDMRFDLQCSTFVRTASIANATAATAAAAIVRSVASSASSNRGGNNPTAKAWEHQVPQRQQSEGFWSQRLSDQWNLENVRPTPATFDLSLKAVTSAKRLVSKVLLAAPIQLKATLFDPTATYTTFAVESCHASSGASMYADIIDRGCPNTETGFTGNFHTFVLAQIGRDAPSAAFPSKPISAASSFISIISSQFPAFVLSPTPEQNGSFRIDASNFHANSTCTIVKIVCAFRLCAHKAWCSLPHRCDGTQEENQHTTFMPPKILFAVRSLALEILNPSPHNSEESNSLHTQGCTSVFCQPRVQLLLIMVSLGAMLCLSMICGCLVSRNHFLFHLKSSSSTSSHDLTICPPNANFLALRDSASGIKSSPTSQPNQLIAQNGTDEMSISTAFLQREPEQNYIQFYNPPQFQSTYQHFHTLPSSYLHETYQSLPHHRHIQCEQGLFSSPHIDNRRGLIYANGEIGEVEPTVLVPVTTTHHHVRSQQLKNGTDWIWERQQQPITQSRHSTLVLDATATAIEPNNQEAGLDFPNTSRNSSGIVENRPLCLISDVKTVGSNAETRPVALAPDILYRLPSKLYMMPEFSYCLASSTYSNNNTNNNIANNSDDRGGASSNPNEAESIE
ncbi:hypothetical protein Aperf_G00000114347 [Anoplocephala perfoliata]